MGEIFMGLTKRVGIFLIAGQTILHFGVGKQYERYVKLMISLMAAAQLIFGFGGLFQETAQGGLTGIFSQDFGKKWEDHMQQFEKELEEKQEQMEIQLTEKMTGIMMEEQSQQKQEQIDYDKKNKNSFHIKIEEIKID